MGPHELEIHEQEEGEHLRLRVLGELDLATAPKLEERLDQARAQRRAVWLDLSGLDFMDSTGITLLVRGVLDASVDGWRLELDPNLSPRVARVIDLANVRALLFGTGQDGRTQRHADPA